MYYVEKVFMWQAATRGALLHLATKLDCDVFREALAIVVVVRVYEYLFIASERRCRCHGSQLTVFVTSFHLPFSFDLFGAISPDARGVLEILFLVPMDKCWVNQPPHL